MTATRLTGARGAGLLAVLTYAAVLGAARLTRSDLGGVNVGFEAASSSAGAALGDVAALLSLGYAFAAGMVAAVNPCGFALLPAYLGLYLGRPELNSAPLSVAVRLAHAARVGLTVCAGFTLLLAVAGLLLGAAATALVRVLPWIGLAVGVTFVAVGARLAGGEMVYVSLGERVAHRLGGYAWQASSTGYFAYGLAYGAASLSCTLPIFLAVVGGASTVGNFASAVEQFILYALGMGMVIVGMTLGLALFHEAVLARARRMLRYVQPASAVLLLVGGAYITYYWLTLGGLLAAAHLA